MTETNGNQGADLLYGAAAIAATWVSRATAYHLISTNKIPSFKLGNKTVCARRSAIDRALEAAEEAGPR